MTRPTQTLERHPWDLDYPQPEIVKLVDEGWIQGSTLDLLCGTGENALYIAGVGSPTLGIDSSHPVLRIAREKAQMMMARRGVCARFKPGRPNRLTDLGETFQTIFDLGLFQSIPDHMRADYLYSLDKVLLPEGKFILIQFVSNETELAWCKQDVANLFLNAGWRLDMDRKATIELQGERTSPAWLNVFSKVLRE